TGDGTHQIAVNKAMQAGAKAGPGDRLQMVLRVDTAPRTVKVPADLKKALTKSKAAQVNFERMTWSHRKRYVDWIEEAKRPETRAKRIDEAVKRISAGQGAFDR
ncbi:MAG: YdeI/OmpD-associated family protein, partial [Thermoplasmata archaeon]